MITGNVGDIVDLQNEIKKEYKSKKYNYLLGTLLKFCSSIYERNYYFVYG